MLMMDGDILKDVLKQYEDDDLNILFLCLNVDGAQLEFGVTVANSVQSKLHYTENSIFIKREPRMP